MIIGIGLAGAFPLSGNPEREQLPGARLLLRNINTRALTQSYQPCLPNRFFKSQPVADFLEELVIRMCHRLGQAPCSGRAHLQHRVARDDVRLQTAERQAPTWQYNIPHDHPS